MSFEALAQDSGLIPISALFAQERQIDKCFHMFRRQVKGFSIRVFRFGLMSGSLVYETEQKEGVRIGRIGGEKIQAHFPRFVKVTFIRECADALERKACCGLRGRRLLERAHVCLGFVLVRTRWS